MLQMIECDGCGRGFSTEDPLGMLATIVGPCPTCSGRFQLAVPDDAPQPEPQHLRRSG